MSKFAKTVAIIVLLLLVMFVGLAYAAWSPVLTVDKAVNSSNQCGNVSIAASEDWAHLLWTRSDPQSRFVTQICCRTITGKRLGPVVDVFSTSYALSGQDIACFRNKIFITWVESKFNPVNNAVYFKCFNGKSWSKDRLIYSSSNGISYPKISQAFGSNIVVCWVENYPDGHSVLRGKTGVVSGSGSSRWNMPLKISTNTKGNVMDPEVSRFWYTNYKVEFLFTWTQLPGHKVNARRIFEWKLQPLQVITPAPGGNSCSTMTGTSRFFMWTDDNGTWVRSIHRTTKKVSTYKVASHSSWNNSICSRGNYVYISCLNKGGNGLFFKTFNGKSWSNPLPLTPSGVTSITSSDLAAGKSLIWSAWSGAGSFSSNLNTVVARYK